jgi:hypothetical protein
MIQAQRIQLITNGELAGPVRHCEVCGQLRSSADFLSHRGKTFNPFCRFCWRFNRKKVIQFLGDWKETNRREQQRKRLVLTFLRALAQRRFSKRGDINGMTPDDYAAKVAKLPDRVAAIVGKTYAEIGDAATLADDTALMMIRDLLFEIDDTLIERNKGKRLSRR